MDSQPLFDLPAPGPHAGPSGAPGLPEAAGGWPEDPVARVLLDSPVPHLDREFDYLVTRELDERARPGVRVRVRFGHRDLQGWLVSRGATPSTGARLSPLRSVVSPEPVLTPEVLELARAVAARYAGTVADVLRSAVPPRVAKVEKQLNAETEHPEAMGTSEITPDPEVRSTERATAWSRLTGGEEFLGDLSTGAGPRAAVSLPSAHGDWDPALLLAEAAARTADGGRGAVVVVPDVRDLERLCRALDARVGSAGYARLTADDGPTPRYRAFLQLRRGQRRIAVGTRSAVWAPVPDPGLVAVWEDGDSLHAEPRAPYQHVREVALLRAELSGSGVLMAATSRTEEVQRLVESGWLGELGVDRAVLHAVTPRVVSTADSWETERDPLLARARPPRAAWQAARDGLAGAEPGPVLIQVGRSGFIPALLCQGCGTPARCRHCGGPLGVPDGRASARSEAACRWCARRERGYECPECGSGRLRAGSRGVDRTAEELGRAFPGVPVLSSSGDHILSTVPGTAALVVATTGAEPVAEGGYAAALLLDGDAQLHREGLRTPGQVLARWFAAAGLVRARGDGGVVVVTAAQEDVVGALVRMDPAGYASRQLAERREVGLPPAVRMAEVSGPAEAVTAFIGLVGPAFADSVAEGSGTTPAGSLPWIGPVPVESAGGGGGGGAVGGGAGVGGGSGEPGESRDPADAPRHRALLFFPYSAARGVLASLRAARAAASARRQTDPVRLRIDPVDLP